MKALRLLVLAAIAVLFCCKGKDTAAPSAPHLGAVANTLGCTYVGQSQFCEAGTDWKAFPANTTSTMWTMTPGAASGESVSAAALIEVELAGAASGGDHSWWQRKFFGSFINGTFTDPAFGTTDKAVDSQVGPTFAGSAANIVQVGNALTVQINCAVACFAKTSISYNRTPVVPAVIGVLTIRPALIATTTAATTTFTITGSDGALLNPTAATAAGHALTNVTVLTPQKITAQLAAGTYAPTTSGDVTVTAQPNPVPCAGCLTITQAQVTNVAPNLGTPLGGTNITISLNAGAIGTTNVLLAGVPVASFNVVDDQTIDAVTGVATFEVGDVTVVGPSNPTALHNGWTYANPPPAITSCTNCFGSAGGQTPAASAQPTISGTGLTSCTSISLNGVAHSSANFTCNVGGTSCSFSTILAGTPGAFTSILATCNDLTSTPYGDGASTGFTYIPASYDLYVAEYVTFGAGSAVAAMTDLGDLAANTPTQGVGANQPTQVTGGSGINGRAAISFSSTHMLGLSTLAARTQGEEFIVSQYGGSGSPSIVMGNNGGSFIPHSDGHIYDDFGVTTRAVNGIVVTGGFASTSTWLYEAAVTSSGTWNDWINGTAQGSASGKTVGFPVAPYFGNPTPGGATYLMGAYILFKNQTLSTGNRAVVKTWLCAWYGLACT